MAILIKWPKNNIIFTVLSTEYLYEIRVQTAKWILRKRCLDMYKAVQYEWPWMKEKWTFQDFCQYKCIRNQIWPRPNKDQGQPRIIICANLVGPTSPMLYTKSQGFTLYGHGRHLGNVTINIWFIFTPLNLRNIHMKFQFNWSNGFWENCVLIYWWASNMSDLGCKVKDQPWPLELPLNISSENNDFGFNRIKKINFSKINKFKCIRKQIWLSC